MSKKSNYIFWTSEQIIEINKLFDKEFKEFMLKSLKDYVKRKNA
jgi:hypothetical protein